MKRTIFLIALLLACVGVAGAQSTDPTIILNGPGSLQSITETTFTGSFMTQTACPTGNSVPPAGGGVCFDGINNSPVNWTSLAITYTFMLNSSAALTISCSTNLFDITNCASGVPVSIADTPTTFTGTVTLDFACSAAALASLAGCGITNFTPDPGFQSFLNYWDANNLGTDIVPGSTTFLAIANVPEPGTISLLLLGVGAIAARRRFAKVRASRS